MRKQRKHCTAKEQVVILRRHFLEKVRVSDLCEELHLQPTVFYVGKRIYSRTEQPPFSPTIAPSASCRRSRNGSNSCRKKSRPKMLDADVVAVSRPVFGECSNKPDCYCGRRVRHPGEGSASNNLCSHTRPGISMFPTSTYFAQRGPAWPLIRHKEQGQWQVACLASNGDLVSRERYVQRIH